MHGYAHRIIDISLKLLQKHIRYTDFVRKSPLFITKIEEVVNVFIKSDIFATKFNAYSRINLIDQFFFKY